MRERKHGTIVNIASVGRVCKLRRYGYYAASKFVLEGLTEALWQEMEPLGIKVLLIEPGGFRTGMVSGIGSVSRSRPTPVRQEHFAASSRTQVKSSTRVIRIAPLM